MREYIWSFNSPFRANLAARRLTRQNKAGRQALKCKPRRFWAEGCCLYAEPMS